MCPKMTVSCVWAKNKNYYNNSIEVRHTREVQRYAEVQTEIPKPLRDTHIS